MQVRAVDISKRYAGLAALDNVSLSVASGELVALLGPSGSGKTTLLRTIAGLEMPDAGAVYFNDRDAAESRIQDRGVGFVFQHYALFKHMVVGDNIAFGMRARKKNRPPEAQIKKRVMELLDRPTIPDDANALMVLRITAGLSHRALGQKAGPSYPTITPRSTNQPPGDGLLRPPGGNFLKAVSRPWADRYGSMKT